MNNHRLFLGARFRRRRKLESKSLWQLKVQLNRGALMRSVQSIFDMNVDLICFKL